MATDLAKRLHAALVTAGGRPIAEMDPLETRFPWPNQPRTVWPIADISGTLFTGERFIVELDDHADPARSVIKYWPLLEAMDRQTFEHPSIVFVEVSRRDDTFGRGFQELARFAGVRFGEMYGDNYRFGFVELDRDDVFGVAQRVLSHLVGEAT